MVLRPRNGLSLCAGAGGLDMGLMLTEPDFHTRCFVEWEESPRQSIIAAQRAGYFAPAPIWDDLRTFDGKPFKGAIDTILAGYPCQPFSQAGQRKGTDDPRHLWPEVARVIREIEPRWVFLENVAGHVSLGAETVLRELRDMGWTPAAGLFSASETGAPHERLRWFCVAHRNGRASANVVNAGGRQLSQPVSEGQQTDDQEAQTGVVGGLERHGRALADASVHRPQGEFANEHNPAGREISNVTTGLRSRAGVYPPGPNDLDAWATVLDHSPDLAPAVSVRDAKRFSDHLAALVASRDMAESEAQSAICRMVDGLAHRSRALKLLGNGVAPLAASNAWRTLGAAHGLRPLDLGAFGPYVPETNNNGFLRREIMEGAE